MKAAVAGLLVLAGISSVCGLGAADRPPRSVWDGVYTFEQAERGERVYQQQCLRCHGRYLDGDTLAPPLEGMLFLSNWDTVTLDKLFVRINRDMADNRGTKQQNADANAAMLAYILAFNGFPSGNSELPSSVQKLGEIVFEQVKPEKK